MSLLPPEIGDAATVLWFFAIEVDEFRYVERVTFSGFQNGVQISIWEISLDERVPALGLINEVLPEPIKIDKASISIKRKIKKVEDSDNG
ncbi:peroxidase [Aeromonas sp. 5HA1]|nr:peroxidase [Aeromonas sp. 5HA1]